MSMKIVPPSRLIIIMVVCMVTSVCGRSFYLSPNGVDAEGRGTVTGSPWKTVSYATGQMNAGDTLLLAAGTYTAETHIDIKNGGSASAPMVIKNQTSAKPVIDLGYIKPPLGLPVADSTDTDPRLPSGQAARSGGEDWYRVISIQVSNVVIDGLILQGALSPLWAGNNSATHSNLQIRNCIIRYCEQYALRLEKYDNVKMENCNVYHCGMINWPRTGAINWPHAIIGWNAHHVVVSKSRVHNNHGEGVGPFQGCAFWEVRNCEVFDNWSVNIYIDLDSTDAVIDGNLIFNTGKYGTTGRNMSDGVRIANEIADCDYSAYGTTQDPSPAVTNIAITNNICINTGGGICAFRYSPYLRFFLKNSLIANNTIVNIPSGYTGVQIYPGDGVEVSNNLIVNCATPTSFTNAGTGITTHNNITTISGGFVTGTGYLAGSYKLMSSSSAVNGGVAMSGVTSDYWGTTRPQGASFDVGANEYVAATNVRPSSRKSQTIPEAHKVKSVVDLKGRRITGINRTPSAMRFNNRLLINIKE